MAIHISSRPGIRSPRLLSRLLSSVQDTSSVHSYILLRLLILTAFAALAVLHSAAAVSRTVDAGATLTIGPEGAEFSILTLRPGATLFLSGGNLKVSSVKGSGDMKIAGYGSLTVADSFTTGPDSRLDFSSISLTLGPSSVMAVGSGSSLFFGLYPVSGGKISFPTPENGRGATISAPPVALFGATAVEGRFHSPEAFPEWFAPQKEPSDWAPCINAAFAHCASGIVRLASRVYPIASTIFIPARSRLSGSLGLWKDGSGSRRRAIEADMTGTRIVVASGPENFMGGCAVLVNYDASDITPSTTFDDLRRANANDGSLDVPLLLQPWGHPSAGITDMTFDVADDAGSPLCCVLAAGSAEFDRVTFQKFSRDIVWSNHYSDLKKVTRCRFRRARFQESVPDSWLLDFGFLGDALICDGNAFDSGHGTVNRFLRLSRCAGGRVTSNIINGDISISGCKGILFSENHLENGARIFISDSEVALSGNFIEKGVSPSVIVRNSDQAASSVLDFSGNQFVYYSTPRPVLVGGRWTMTSALNSGKQNTVPLSRISDYDIELRPISSGAKETAVPSRAVMSFRNDYRYWITSGLVSMMLTSGISICRSSSRDGATSDDDLIPVGAFNTLSCVYSSGSLVTFGPDPVISAPVRSVDPGTGATVRPIGLNPNTRWFASPSSYSYSYCILDKGDETASRTPQSLGSFTVPADGSRGVLFGLRASASASTATVRMIRHDDASGHTVYADIPLVNCTVFYDNGVSVGAYRWRKAASVARAASAPRP